MSIVLQLKAAMDVAMFQGTQPKWCAKDRKFHTQYIPFSVSSDSCGICKNGMKQKDIVVFTTYETSFAYWYLHSYVRNLIDVITC